MRKDSNKIDTLPTNGGLFPLSLLQNKKIEVTFNAPDLSSQGGLLLLCEAERQNGFISQLASCIEDTRYQPFVQHSYKEMLIQRIYQIAAGYSDADDSDLLRDDSILKICTGRTPDDKDLSSQPTISRLENKMTDRELFNIGLVFLSYFVASYKKPPKQIILDLDDSNFNTYGDQQGTLFNNYYGEHCYMPLFIFEGISGKMILPLLRPGRRNKSNNIYKILRRLINYLRRVWKHTQIIVRGDSHFCCHELMDWNQERFNDCEDFVNWTNKQRGVYFITGLTRNSKLSQKTEVWVENAKASFAKHKQPICFFKTFMYQAGTWKHWQRVIVKIEVTGKGANTRYIVTNFEHRNSAFLYQTVYCGRGEMELYIKELKTYLDASRMSCNKFEANQFRLFLHAAAYVILLEIKQNTFEGTALENVSILTFREKIILSAVHIRTLKTKIKIEFSTKHPYRELLEEALRKSEHRRTVA
jgi:hypothetical protein